MYPHVVQFETRRQQFARELRLIRELEQARAERTGARSRRRTEMKQQEIVLTKAADRQRPQAPSRRRLAFLTWVGAYAVITLILQLLGPLMAPWPLPLRTLLLSALMVAALTWVVMPTLARLFRGWLLAHNG
jgi:antibiotic biosynthesis monooxygenase (ABM) superfamily enzyme